MSEFTCGMTQREESQLTSQALAGCLQSKRVGARSVHWEQLELCYNFYYLGII